MGILFGLRYLKRVPSRILVTGNINLYYLLVLVEDLTLMNYIEDFSYRILK